MTSTPVTYRLSAFADEAAPDTDGQIAALQRAGLRTVDLRNVDGFNISALPVENARTVAQKLQDAGITVGMFGSPIGKIDLADDVQSDVDRLRHLGELAPILNATDCRIFSFYNGSGAPHDAWRDESLRRLELLRDEAQKLGLRLYHENERHIFGDLCEDVETIAQLRNDNFKLIFDFDNFNQSGENVWANWERLREKTDAIHLKDSKSGQHTPVGEGTGYVREIMADCVSRGWSGPLSIEPHLSHSGAVALTGPSGVANAQYSVMPATESFQIACQVATDLLREVGAKFE